MSLIDLHVAQKLKTRREALNIKRRSIAHDLGVSYQQIQKYETGQNRISASRLYQLSHTLHVPVGYFFEDLPAPYDTQKLVDSETLKLLDAYFNVPQTKIRKHIITLLELIGEDLRNSKKQTKP